MLVYPIEKEEIGDQHSCTKNKIRDLIPSKKPTFSKRRILSSGVSMIAVASLARVKVSGPYRVNCLYRAPLLLLGTPIHYG